MSFRTKFALLAAVGVLSVLSSGTVANATVFSTPYTPGTPAVPPTATLINSYSGTLDASSPVWRRAAQSANGSETAPNAPTALGTAGNYPYQVRSFVAPASGVFNFYSAQAHDGYLHLYQDAFDPNNQLVNALAGDDDMSSLNGGTVPNRNGVTTTNDSGFTYSLNQGTTYFLVNSTFSAAVPTNGAYYNEYYTVNGGSPAVPASPISNVPDGGSTPSSNSPGEALALTLTVPTGGNVTAFNAASIINAAHTYLGDLTITLTHNGVTVDLLDRVGRTSATSFGSAADLTAGGTVSFADGGTAVTATDNLLNGTTYAPYTNGLDGIESSPYNGALSSFVGLPVGGDWILTITDWAASDVGTISAFSIDVTTGSTTPAIAGDYNHDGFVDAADYTVWADSFGLTGTGLAADGNSDGVVDAADYTIWADHFGQGSPPAGLSGAVPEPAGAGLLGAATVLALAQRRRR